MEKPLVSVIVPIYKVEEYIGDCIKSVESQDYSNWELVLVDDGSPDKSGEICDSFSTHNPRIKVIHQNNQGVSSARRNGLLSCNGKWVFFLDGDDQLTHTSLSTLVSFCEDNHLDVCIGGFDILTTKGIIRTKNKGGFTIIEKKDYIRGVAECKYMMALWGKLYNRDILLKANIIIDRCITNNEDYMYNLFLSPQLNRVGVLEQPIYIYNKIRDQRASSNKCNDKYWKLFLGYLRQEAPKYGVPIEYSFMARSYKIYMLLRNDTSFDLYKLGDEINDMRQVESIKGMPLWQKLTVFLCKHPNSFIISLIQFHPTLFLYRLGLRR